MLPNILDVVVIRFIVRHGFSRDMADMLLEDIKRSVEHLEQHPPGKTLTAAEATGFTHHALPKEKLPPTPGASGYTAAAAQDRPRHHHVPGGSIIRGLGGQPMTTPSGSGSNQEPDGRSLLDLGRRPDDSGRRD